MRVLPIVVQEPCFALKGGTAINLFIRDMPRLSVDIDLAYLPVKPRDESLQEIDILGHHSLVECPPAPPRTCLPRSG